MMPSDDAFVTVDMLSTDAKEHRRHRTGALGAAYRGAVVTHRSAPLAKRKTSSSGGVYLSVQVEDDRTRVRPKLQDGT